MIIPRLLSPLPSRSRRHFATATRAGRESTASASLFCHKRDQLSRVIRGAIDPVGSRENIRVDEVHDAIAVHIDWNRILAKKEFAVGKDVRVRDDELSVALVQVGQRGLATIGTRAFSTRSSAPFPGQQTHVPNTKSAIHI